MIMKAYEIKKRVEVVLSAMGFTAKEIKEIIKSGEGRELRLCVTSSGSNIIIDTPLKDFTILSNEKDEDIVEDTLSDIKDFIISGDLILIE